MDLVEEQIRRWGWIKIKIIKYLLRTIGFVVCMK